jgi:hypothetical protein
MNDDIRINKGVELMLRRELETPLKEPSGFVFSQTVSLLKKKFNLKFEFTWEDR